VLVIPGEVGEPSGLEVPPTVYGFLVAMLAAFATLILFSFVRGAEKGQLHHPAEEEGTSVKRYIGSE
jgi:hypothetical protein